MVNAISPKTCTIQMLHKYWESQHQVQHKGREPPENSRTGAVGAKVKAAWASCKVTLGPTKATSAQRS